MELPKTRLFVAAWQQTYRDSVFEISLIKRCDSLKQSDWKTWKAIKLGDPWIKMVEIDQKQNWKSGADKSSQTEKSGFVAKWNKKSRRLRQLKTTFRKPRLKLLTIANWHNDLADEINDEEGKDSQL